MSVVRSIEVVRISEVKNTLYIYGKSNRCHDTSPLYGGCPLLGESVMGGFTVIWIVQLIMPYYSLITKILHKSYDKFVLLMLTSPRKAMLYGVK